MTKTKTKKPATTETTEPRVWTRTVTLPFGFDRARPTVSLCSSADGAWFLVEPSGAVIGQIVRERDLEIAREDGSINVVIPLRDCGFGLPLTALAPLRRVFPSWRVSGDMQTWERVFEMEAFIAALRIS